MTDIIYKEESYKIVGICMEIHNILGKGFSEIVYKDALEYEFKNNNISFEREKEFCVKYKNIILPHKFYADFTVFNKIIIEVKSVDKIINENINQVINYLKVSNYKLGLLVNFNKNSLETKRIVL